MKTQLLNLREKYKTNPAWYWLLFTLFSFPLLPEYVSPFILFAAYIVFKRQWTKEGRFAKVGNIGKLELILLTYMLISVLWSKTKLDTLGSAGLWWAVILVQIMIYNLARTKKKIDTLLTTVVASAAISGIVGALQMVTYILCQNGALNPELVLTTPFYRNFDAFVYEHMPFKISTHMFYDRASGFYSNPNLLCCLMLVAFPMAAYLFLSAETKKQKRFSFCSLIAISFGTASTMTRAGCILIIIQWAVLFILFVKNHFTKAFSMGVPVLITSIPALLVRSGKLSYYWIQTTYAERQVELIEQAAIKSSDNHFRIWSSMIDYISHHIGVFIFGMGFGCEQTGNVLLGEYNLNKPHSHNFIIEIWAEIGLIGIIALFVIIAYAVGKVFEIDLRDFKTLSLSMCILASFAGLVVFGLTDYIFNSPKQIILFTMVIGIIQAMSYTYDKHEIKTARDLTRIAKANMNSIIHQ